MSDFFPTDEDLIDAQHQQILRQRVVDMRRANWTDDEINHAYKTWPEERPTDVDPIRTFRTNNNPRRK